ncbi:MAG: hypothetical protein ACI38A_06085 [Candidatus Ornithomonoglobus sp.]
MNIISLIALIVSVVSVIASFIFSLITAVRASKHDSSEQSAGIATITSDVGYVKSSVDDIKSHQQRTDECMHDIDKQLVEVNASAKSAHKRLDEHEIRIEQLENHDGGG